MIKLFKILNESAVDDAIANISKTINSCKFITTMLYRGKKKALSGYKAHRIIVRTDRNPKDTSVPVDSFLEIYRQIYFPDKPSRRNAVFATSKASNARTFGDVYYIFLPKQSKIWYNNKYEDSLTFTQHVRRDIYWQLEALYDVYNYMEVNPTHQKTFEKTAGNNFMTLLSNLNIYANSQHLDKKDFDKIYNLYNLKNLKSDINKLYNQFKNIEKISQICRAINSGFDVVDEYYKQLIELEIDGNGYIKNFITEGAELLIECKYYYLVSTNKFIIRPDSGSKHKYIVKEYK